jgi:hypothetical protein
MNEIADKRKQSARVEKRSISEQFMDSDGNMHGTI